MDKIKSTRETDMGAVIVIDSMLEPAEVLIQNPERPCPPEILEKQALLTVRYVSFDERYHDGQIVVDARLVHDVRSFFELATMLEFPIEKVAPAVQFGWSDDAMMDQNITSGFNYRTIAGTEQISLHGKGMAFDVNTRLNPYYRYENGQEIIAPQGAQYDTGMPGTMYPEHPLVQHMKSLGWEWGGDWTRESGKVDYQHFQKNLDI